MFESRSSKYAADLRESSKLNKLSVSNEQDVKPNEAMALRLRNEYPDAAREVIRYVLVRECFALMRCFAAEKFQESKTGLATQVICCNQAKSTLV